MRLKGSDFTKPVSRLYPRGSFSLLFYVTNSNAHNFRHTKVNQVIPKSKMKLILCRILLYNLFFIPKFLTHVIMSQPPQALTRFVDLTKILCRSFKTLDLQNSSQNLFLGKKESNIKIITT